MLAVKEGFGMHNQVHTGISDGTMATDAVLKARKRINKILYIAAGTLFVALGALGAVLPLLPTTPFLLLAAACYMRSSRKLYTWLLTNRVFGEYLRRYREGEGLPLSFKIWTIALLWLSLGSSALFAVPSHLWWVHLLLLAVGIGVTSHLVHVKTRR
jgi:uncharacterized protein